MTYSIMCLAGDSEYSIWKESRREKAGKELKKLNLCLFRSPVGFFFLFLFLYRI